MFLDKKGFQRMVPKSGSMIGQKSESSEKVAIANGLSGS
jgi:hypothetical protein